MKAVVRISSTVGGEERVYRGTSDAIPKRDITVSLMMDTEALCTLERSVAMSPAQDTTMRELLRQAVGVAQGMFA